MIFRKNWKRCRVSLSLPSDTLSWGIGKGRVTMDGSGYAYIESYGNRNGALSR